MTFLKRRFPVIFAYLHPVAHYLRMLSFALMREMDAGGLKERAKSLVYTSLLSLAPLLAVSFSILKGFGVHNQVEPLLSKFLEPLGEKGAEITDNVIFFVENIKVGVLGFLGFLLLFYTAISLLAQIEDCFNHIWRVTKPRSIYRRFTDYLSVILIGPVFLFSALGITASMGNSEVVRGLIQMQPFGTAYYMIGLVLPYLLIVAAFSFAYAFIPNSKIKLVPALIGGLVAGLAWKTTGVLFARFIANSAQYSAIYSGFAVILLAMIWLYISWLILLMGSVIVFHIQYPRYLHYAKRRPHLSIQCQERLAVLLMALIGQQQLKGGEVFTLKHLADAVNVPWEAVADILLCLQQSGLLMTLEEDSRFVLAHDTDAIFLRDIVQAIRSAGDTPKIAATQIEASPAMQNTLQELAQHSTNFLQDRSLRDILWEAKSGVET
ncbi:MAG: YihY/virulence factor BrkB family protein [Methylomonas sp.]|jgi:membrane protein|uniref:YhjD/YihY/BrkB family envelope integrity protein n=1 Tax=Methylomonas sp. TaxID=418 RepID=UPI0025E7DD77|nr:YhjD/YihY/BrkB family envelope integrity protein [Methylomonas sp.]MCK9604994.1 YihY/virulence factor BrkB family protein [Methylomonas sp.]